MYSISTRAAIYYLAFFLSFFFFCQMPRFGVLNNGKITTNVLFYDRGVPPRESNFGALVAVNYEMLKNIARYHKQNNIPFPLLPNGGAR